MEPVVTTKETQKGWELGNVLKPGTYLRIHMQIGCGPTAEVKRVCKNGGMKFDHVMAVAEISKCQKCQNLHPRRAEGKRWDPILDDKKF